jgi:hypothetical protein
MEVKATVIVIEGPRQVEVKLDITGGNAYGQHPVVGATEKVLGQAVPIIKAALD